MLQRVGIAQAIINDPKVVFLDEPMSGLDPIGRREVRNLILQLKREGKTIFFSTHILNDVETLCDRIAILNRGKVIGSGTLNELFDQEVSHVEVVTSGIPADKLRELAGPDVSVSQSGSTSRLELPAQAPRVRESLLVSNRPPAESFQSIQCAKRWKTTFSSWWENPSDEPLQDPETDSLPMKVLHIARNTFRECVRDKVLYNLVIFAVLIIVSSLILGAITIGDVKQIIINLGLSTISLFGTLIAIFIGIQLVHKEIDKKTVYSLLSKPVARHEFILGKYLGLSMTLAVNVSRDDPRRVRGSALSSTFLPGFGCANSPGWGSDSRRADAGDCDSPVVFDLFDTCPVGSLCFLPVRHRTLQHRYPPVWRLKRLLGDKGGGQCDVLSFAQLWKLRHHLQDCTRPIHLKLTSISSRPFTG